MVKRKSQKTKSFWDNKLIIDADYYNNQDNEGEIFVQLLNFAPCDIKIKAGDRICQGIIKNYLVTEDDAASGERTGGLGSTGN